MQHVCPQCKTTPVIKTNQRGTSPRCSKCLEENKRGRITRQQQRRKAGAAKSHHAADGSRYTDRTIAATATCHFCAKPFKRGTKRNGRDVCQRCKPRHKEDLRKRSLERIKAAYRKDPEKIKRRRLTLILERMGLSIEWYDAQPKVCGICGTTNPGRSWCLDHNHTCCPYGVRQGCKRCVRGLLCQLCNRGLGHFKDDPALLAQAIKWLHDHPLK